MDLKGCGEEHVKVLMRVWAAENGQYDHSYSHSLGGNFPPISKNTESNKMALKQSLTTCLLNQVLKLSTTYDTRTFRTIGV
jgi:hypothetical protein